MSGGAEIPANVRAMAEQAGLAKAIKLFPDGVKGAAERGLKPVGDPPGGHSPIAAPAAVFDPSAFERRS